MAFADFLKGAGALASFGNPLVGAGLGVLGTAIGDDEEERKVRRMLGGAVTGADPTLLSSDVPIPRLADPSMTAPDPTQRGLGVGQINIPDGLKDEPPSAANGFKQDTGMDSLTKAFIISQLVGTGANVIGQYLEGREADRLRKDRRRALRALG